MALGGRPIGYNAIGVNSDSQPIFGLTAAPLESLRAAVLFSTITDLETPSSVISFDQPSVEMASSLTQVSNVAPSKIELIVSGLTALSQANLDFVINSDSASRFVLETSPSIGGRSGPLVESMGGIAGLSPAVLSLINSFKSATAACLDLLTSPLASTAVDVETLTGIVETIPAAISVQYTGIVAVAGAIVEAVTSITGGQLSLEQRASTIGATLARIESLTGVSSVDSPEFEISRMGFVQTSHVLLEVMTGINGAKAAATEQLAATLSRVNAPAQISAALLAVARAPVEKLANFKVRSSAPLAEIVQSVTALDTFAAEVQLSIFADTAARALARIEVLSGTSLITTAQIEKFLFDLEIDYTSLSGEFSPTGSLEGLFKL